MVDKYNEAHTYHIIIYILPAKHALQGHPESPRFWVKMMHTILKELHFTSCAHEPCLYICKLSKELVYFLRQVDDFDTIVSEIKEYATTYPTRIQALI